MKKRIISLLLLTMTVTLFAGCGSSTEPKDDSKVSSEDKDKEGSDENGSDGKESNEKNSDEKDSKKNDSGDDNSETNSSDEEDADNADDIDVEDDDTDTAKEIDEEAIAEFLVNHYMKSYKPEGNYVIFTEEDEFDGNNLRMILRYQISDEEAEAILESGDIPVANVYVTTIFIDLSTMEAVDEAGNPIEIKLN